MEVDDGDLEVTHRFAFLNCCTVIRMEAAVAGDIVEVTEVVANPGELCFCQCVFDLSVRLENVPPGPRTVRVLDSEGGLVGQREVEVPGRPRGVLVEVEGDAVHVANRGAIRNCCASIAYDAALQDRAIALRERVENPGEECDCVCAFDLEVTVSGLYDGSYEVSVPGSGREGPVIVPVVVEDGLPLVEVVDGRLVRHWLFGNCCTDVGLVLVAYADGVLDVEERHLGGEPCPCMCWTDLTAPFEGLDPGDYTVRVRSHGELLGEAEFSVE